MEKDAKELRRLPYIEIGSGRQGLVSQKNKAYV